MSAKPKLSAEVRRRLEVQLVKLGDMMGDGMHLERGGKWIAKEYRETALALGLIKPPPRPNNSARINELMAQRVQEVACPSCGSGFKQTRRGSMVADCTGCGARYKLLSTGKTKAEHPAKEGKQ